VDTGSPWAQVGNDQQDYKLSQPGRPSSSQLKCQMSQIYIALL